MSSWYNKIPGIRASMGSDGQNMTYFHTESGIGEWWWVDLLVTRCVRTVVITNRFKHGECPVSAL